MARHQKIKKLRGFVVIARDGESIITPEDTSFFQTEKGAERCARGYGGRVAPARMIIEEPLFPQP